MASQITGVSIVCSAVCSGASKIRVTAVCDGTPPGDSPHKGPVTRNMFSFDGVIMFPATTIAIGASGKGVVKSISPCYMFHFLEIDLNNDTIDKKNASWSKVWQIGVTACGDRTHNHLIQAVAPTAFTRLATRNHDDIIKCKTFSALLAICVGNSPVTGEFPAQRPVTRSFDVFFDPRLNKRLSKQWWDWWFATPSRPLWRHCNVHQNSSTYENSARARAASVRMVMTDTNNGTVPYAVLSPRLN